MIEGSRAFASMRTSASGLSAQRLRMDVIAENIANASTTRTSEGGPYARKIPILGTLGDGTMPRFSQLLNTEMSLARSHRQHLPADTARLEGAQEAGVAVQRIVRDRTEGPLLYDPSHPDADESGYVRMPNVEIIQELLTLMGAARAYEANLAAMRASTEAANDTLRISS